jgi:hypothetical protein
MTGSDAILSPDTLEGDKQLITVLLAQFNACRAEILARSTTQATIINLNVTATGLIAGYYFGYHANPLVLLVIPILSPMLGIIWADHAINIGNIGRFIQNGLMPKLGAALKQRIPDYEISIRAFERRIGWRLLLLLAPMVLLFAILPAAALVLAWMLTPVRDLPFYLLAGAGAVLVVIFGGFSVSILMGWIWNDTAAAAAANIK